ncbi:MAG: bifunctional UDP-N-acetylglucosamine diphosphorylase/glucosamine-1-phosphate N-acetyltransferase GlmU, partial [Anaerolineales bacterium]
MTLAAVILAAGQGTRFKSTRPKVLHRLGGQPLVRYAIEAARAMTDVPPVLVIGHGAEALRAELGEAVQYTMQSEQLGTGHAVRQAAPLLEGQCSHVLVTYGDMPLLRAETLKALIETQSHNTGPLTMLTIDAPQLSDFGRIVRDADGNVTAIVELAQATPEQKTIVEKNVGAYCFNADWLWAHLPQLPLSPKGEYYLTDIVALAVAEGGHVAVVKTEDEAETLGINTRAQLAQAEAALRARINTHWMAEGVTLIDPAMTYIESLVTVGRDTVIWPNVHLQGNTSVGVGCVIGPNTIMRDTVIGDECHIECSVLEEAWVGDEVEIGPFAHLRKGARLERGAHMGNFGEVKNSTLGPGVKMGHFSYIGDATIGAGSNIGAGTITCNFDGVKKNKTIIGHNVFIGSDTMLVAPVTLGDGARTGAGSVVTKDVPA